MSDNVKVNQSKAGDAVDVRTVDIGGIQHPVYILYGSNGTEAHIDQYSGAVGSIEQEHLKIHEGKGFTLAQRISITNLGGTYEFLGVVPANVFPHFRHITVSSDGGPSDVDFYEGATYSATGSAITPYNNNRNSITTAELLVYDSPTLTTDGTLLEPILIPGTKQAGSLGSEGSNEWNLKENEAYMIRITNNTAGAGTSNYTINMFWYE